MAKKKEETAVAPATPAAPAYPQPVGYQVQPQPVVAPAQPVPAVAVPTMPSYPQNAQYPAPAYPAVPPAAAVVIPPPVARPKNPFINAQTIWALGGRFTAQVGDVRPAGTGNYKNVGWFLDLLVTSYQTQPAALAQPLPYTLRVNQDSAKHHKLFERFGPNWKGQTITCRAAQPQDNTKEHVVIE